MVEIELRCPRCLARFAAAPFASPEEVCGRMIEEGGWFGLTDAPTFEDMILATVLQRGDVLCGECGAAVRVNETNTAVPGGRLPLLTPATLSARKRLGVFQDKSPDGR